MNFIHSDKLSFSYCSDVGSTELILKDIDIDICEGKYVTIIGHNGSGKSTLARHLNALLVPTGGSIYVGGLDTRNGEYMPTIRQSVGMVFQNPDNQFVASVVEDDVAFGPENIGVPTKGIWDRVKNALTKLSLDKFSESTIERLSGGQKQRVAIAGVIALKPDCIVLDEATSMLDPRGKQEVMTAIRELNKHEGVTIIQITHDMEEALESDYIFVMNEGCIVKSGTPTDVFYDEDRLDKLHLEAPEIVKLVYMLRKAGIDIDRNCLTIKEIIDELSI